MLYAMPFGFMTTQQINDIVATTTANTFSYLNAVLPTLLVFAVVFGVLWLAVRWVKSIAGGHGQRM